MINDVIDLFGSFYCFFKFGCFIYDFGVFWIDSFNSGLDRVKFYIKG